MKNYNLVLENYLEELQFGRKKYPAYGIPSEGKNVHSIGKAILGLFMAIVSVAGAKMAWDKLKEIADDIFDAAKSAVVIGGKTREHTDDYAKGKLVGYAQGFDKGKEFGEHEGFKEGAKIVLATTTILALLTSIAYKIYQTKYSPAAKACSEFSGLKKKSCMKKFLMEASKSRIMALEKGLEICDKLSRTPNLCKQRVHYEIRKEKAKLGEL
jgi:hypothetical protein